MITNKIGLEAEFFVVKDNQLVLPGDYGFDTDEYIILGEFRAEPGKTPSESVANFLKSWYETKELAKKKGVEVCIDPYKTISKKFHADIMRRMGTKEISVCSNLYGTDILEDTDAVIKDGIITDYYLSIGLHIHFSSEEVQSKKVTLSEQYLYDSIKLPISLTGEKDSLFNIDLYKKGGKLDAKEVTVTASCNRITKPVINYIVKEFDEKVLPLYLPDVKLKFRQPGFYEVKYDGRFEYRSLPMCQKAVDDIFSISTFAFELLNGINL